jgi:GTP-binding protein
MDLPGYGFAKLPREKREWITKMITWYFFTSGYNQDLIVLIIDAKVGPTQEDLEMIAALEKYEKNLVIVANKIDKISKLDLEKQLAKIQSLIKNQTIIPYSAEKKVGIELLSKEIEDILKIS